MTDMSRPASETERNRGAKRVSSMDQAMAGDDRLGRIGRATVDHGVAIHGGFTDFYKANRASLVKVLTLTLGDRELAIEAVDEAMARAYQRWGHVQSLANGGGWVYRVALNWATSVLRRRTRAARTTLYDAGVTDIPPITDPDVHRALAELDVKHRAVIVCRYLVGWSEEETADALDLRIGTVKSRLSRASRILRARLDHLRPDADR